MRLVRRIKRLTKRRWILGLFLFFLLFILVCIWARWRPAQRFEPGEPRTGELRLTNWNVGYFAPTSDKNARDFDVRRIADVLKRLSTHVVVLQELASIEQANAIAQHLGENWRAFSVETGLHDQVLAVLSKLPMGDVELNEAGGRRMIGVPFYDVDGHGIFIVGVHSPHPMRGRRDTIENIRGAVSMVAKRKEPIRIIAGDFNFNFDVGEAKNGGDSLYREIVRILSDSTVSIGETYYAHMRIDHVFHYPNELKVIKGSSGMVDISFRVAKAPGFRDHRPVVVTFDTGTFFRDP